METMSMSRTEGFGKKRKERSIRSEKESSRVIGPVFHLALQDKAKPIISIIESMDMLATMGRWGENGWWQPFREINFATEAISREGFYIKEAYPNGVWERS